MTASQISKQKMKSIEADIAEQRSYFIALANGDANYVDKTIHGITEMLYENKVYDSEDEAAEEKTSISLEPVEEAISENNIEILFDFKSFKQSRPTPYFLFPGAINKPFFTSISTALKKQGFISSAELFVYRFFPVMEEDVDLEQPLIWYGDFESLVFTFRLLIHEKLISDLRLSKKGKSLIQLLSEAFYDSQVQPLKANSLRKTAHRTGVGNESLDELLRNLNEETGAIYKIFKTCSG